MIYEFFMLILVLAILAIVIAIGAGKLPKDKENFGAKCNASGDCDPGCTCIGASFDPPFGYKSGTCKCPDFCSDGGGELDNTKQYCCKNNNWCTCGVGQVCPGENAACALPGAKTQWNTACCNDAEKVDGTCPGCPDGQHIYGTYPSNLYCCDGTVKNNSTCTGTACALPGSTSQTDSKCCSGDTNVGDICP